MKEILYMTIFEKHIEPQREPGLYRINWNHPYDANNINLTGRIVPVFQVLINLINGQRNCQQYKYCRDIPSNNVLFGSSLYQIPRYYGDRTKKLGEKNT